MAICWLQLEHVCEDYVVASSVVRDGCNSVTARDTSHTRELYVLHLVELATVLLQIAIACRPPGGERLRFKVGIHSGSVIGAIAGRKRRFYRLFGDSMNTTA